MGHEESRMGQEEGTGCPMDELVLGGGFNLALNQNLIFAGATHSPYGPLHISLEKRNVFPLPWVVLQPVPTPG